MTVKTFARSKTKITRLKILLPDEKGNNKFRDLRRWLEIAMDKKFLDYKIAKLKNPNLDIPELPSQNPNDNNNQDIPPSPPLQRRRRSDSPHQTPHLGDISTSGLVGIAIRPPMDWYISKGS